MQKITTCFWFDSEAQDAANYYVSVFKDAKFDAKINRVIKYPQATEEVSGKPPGSVMTVEFELAGANFVALNGGRVEGFKFSPAASFIVNCETQEEIDHLWEKLSAVPAAEQCGWCTDKFGITWQIVPKILDEYMADPDPKKAERVTAAFLPMKKLDIAKLKAAYEG